MRCPNLDRMTELIVVAERKQDGGLRILSRERRELEEQLIRQVF